MGKWGKWALLLAVAMAFAVPVWAVDLKLGGKYEIQGRYYDHQNIIEKEDVRDHSNPITSMYLKHYFNLYPEIVVNDKISIKGDLEVFDNRISQSDSYQYYDKSSRAATNVGQAGQADADYYSLFTVNELYVDALTGVGKFIVGKTKMFNGIGWFIQVPEVPDWTFGLVWNKLNEGGVPNSYYGYASGVDGSDTAGLINNRDLGDEDEFALIANYAKDAIDFKGQLGYKITGADNTRTQIWLPQFYFNYKVNKNLTFNSKFGFSMGTLVDKDSRCAKESVAEFQASALVGASETVDGMIIAGIGPEPDPWDAGYDAWVATYDALYAANYGPVAADINNTFNDAGLEKDLEVDNAFGVWLGAGYTLDAFKIQGDVMYLKGADAPNKVSAYTEDYENLDTWLMNDVADLYSVKIQTPATISALGKGGKRGYTDGDKGTQWDGVFSFANAILARVNLAYKFTPKLDGNLNLVWGKMENTDYLEKWYTMDNTYRALNLMAPDAMKVGGTGIVTDGGNTLVVAPTSEFDMKDDMGYEARARLNYALQDNLSIGLDLCYYVPGKLYKNLIENTYAVNDTTGAVTVTDSGNKMMNTYAARWRATVKF